MYDICSQDGIDFIVMEYLEGETLADRLATGLLPLQQAMKIVVEIADALDKAHQEGIIHRDWKLGNIMLTKSGAKLMDFGLAKPVTATIITVPRASSQTPCPPTMSVTALTAQRAMWLSSAMLTILRPLRFWAAILCRTMRTRFESVQRKPVWRRATGRGAGDRAAAR
ncbi:protein kinase domain-containing protein [Edaphobacter aggregans]|uniref:protein kinase domain-containing protein n=1 Tax=Edaphobacter aggregans TaxID=570835 RepID=UPI003CCC3884